MRYKDLARTFEIIASYNSEGVVMDYAKHDEYGFDLHYGNIELKPSEVRELAKMGWGLGNACDDYDEDIMAPWENPSEYTDEELMALWNEYKTIHKYA